MRFSHFPVALLLVLPLPGAWFQDLGEARKVAPGEENARRVKLREAYEMTGMARARAIVEVLREDARGATRHGTWKISMSWRSWTRIPPTVVSPCKFSGSCKNADHSGRP